MDDVKNNFNTRLCMLYKPRKLHVVWKFNICNVKCTAVKLQFIKQ